MGGAVFMAFIIGSNTPGEHAVGVTYAFATIVVAELLLAYTCRSFTKTTFDIKTSFLD